MKKLFSVEAVAYGHPDKIADQISDALLDAYIKVDKNVKAGIETMVKDNIVVLGGEVSSTEEIDVSAVIREVFSTMSFSNEHNLTPEDIKIINLIGKQSPQIQRAVVKEDGEFGAGDQGFMVGFASADTPNYMPLGMYIAKKIADKVALIKLLGPDVKSQVTIEESESGEKRIHTILVSTMHSEGISVESVRKMITDIISINQREYTDKETKIIVNPAGKWTMGGPVADCGLTGRKIVADQYGAYCTVGGGAFSGKDATKSDRSAAYLCRYIAKNIVASGFAHTAKVELAYMIGVIEPVSINVELHNKNGHEIYVNDYDKLIQIIRETFPMTSRQIINQFDLRRPIFYQSARYGHFGIEDEFHPWEKTDKVEILKEKFII